MRASWTYNHKHKVVHTLTHTHSNSLTQSTYRPLEHKLEGTSRGSERARAPRRNNKPFVGCCCLEATELSIAAKRSKRTRHEATGGAGGQRARHEARGERRGGGEREEGEEERSERDEPHAHATRRATPSPSAEEEEEHQQHRRTTHSQRRERANQQQRRRRKAVSERHAECNGELCAVTRAAKQSRARWSWRPNAQRWT